MVCCVFIVFLQDSFYFSFRLIPEFIENRCVNFRGKTYYQLGRKALPNVFYAISDSGWMTTNIFEQLFEKFCKTIWMVTFIHLKWYYTSIKVIVHPMPEDVTLIKLLAHVTDLLQQSRCTCLSPLRRFLEKVFNLHLKKFGSL